MQRDCWRIHYFTVLAQEHLSYVSVASVSMGFVYLLTSRLSAESRESADRGEPAS